MPIKITSKKVSKNNVHISTIKITLITVRGNNVDFLTIEITSKKVRGNNVDFSTSKITSKKVRENHVDFLTIEITSKNYAKMTWKLARIWSSTYWRNIHVKLTWIRRGVPFGYLKSIADSSVFKCHQIITVLENISTKKTNTIATNVTSTTSMSCRSIKVRDYSILCTVLLALMLLLIIIIIFYHCTKQMGTI